MIEKDFYSKSKVSNYQPIEDFLPQFDHTENNPQNPQIQDLKNSI